MKYLISRINRLGTRNSNQDRFNTAERDNAVLMVLADGMGGYRGGDLAAEVAVQKLLDYFRMTKLPVAEPKIFFENAFSFAHKAVIDCGARHTPPLNPRTTLVACLIQEESMWSAHVGDSRCYLLRNGDTVFRTRDHSLVEELLQMGRLTPEEMKTHPNLNQVTRAIGGLQEHPAVEVSGRLALETNDIILLCSDGLWTALDDELIGGTLLEYKKLPEALNTLAGRAESRSYPKSDNISIMAMRWISNETQAQHPGTEQPGIEPLPEQQQVIEAIDEIDEAIKKVNLDIKPAVAKGS
jgi:serine/threonine protein phosphatase PrpC